MAQTMVVTCDWVLDDGTSCKHEVDQGSKPSRLTVAGKHLEVDLCKDHLETLESLLTPVLLGARIATPSRTSPRTVAKSGNTAYTSADIRAWKSKGGPSLLKAGSPEPSYRSSWPRRQQVHRRQRTFERLQRYRTTDTFKEQ